RKTTEQEKMLQNLPLDILYHLTIHYLDLPTAISLSSVSPGLHYSLKPLQLCSQEAKALFFLQAEHFPQNTTSLTCFTCWRLLPLTNFPDSQRRGPSGKSGHNIILKTKRICWNCAVTTKRYAHLRPVNKNGITFYPCHICLKSSQKGAHEKCRVLQEIPQGRGAEQKRLKSTICFPPKPTPIDVSIPKIQTLPWKILEKILSGLKYPSLISLRQTNTFFLHKTNPVKHCLSIYDKYTFTLTQWKTLIPLRPGRLGGWAIGPGRGEWCRPCFGCFSVKPLKHFPWKYFQREWNAQNSRCWQMRCWKCLQRFYYHPVSLNDKEGLREWKRQRMCEWCDCLRWSDEEEKECEGCLVKADMVERRKKKIGKKMELKRNTEKFVGWFEGEGAVGKSEDEEEEGEVVDLFGGMGFFE
ncbi:hypothetical protein QBC38DRAFT_373821, partial [Podospora fimiseda]